MNSMFTIMTGILKTDAAKFSFIIIYFSQGQPPNYAIAVLIA